MSSSYRHPIRMGALVLGLVLSVALVFAMGADHSWDAPAGAQIRPTTSAPSAFVGLNASSGITTAAVGALAFLSAAAIAGLGLPAAARSRSRALPSGTAHPSSHPFVLRI